MDARRVRRRPGCRTPLEVGLHTTIGYVFSPLLSPLILMLFAPRPSHRDIDAKVPVDPCADGHRAQREPLKQTARRRPCWCSWTSRQSRRSQCRRDGRESERPWPLIPRSSSVIVKRVPGCRQVSRCCRTFCEFMRLLTMSRFLTISALPNNPRRCHPSHPSLGFLIPWPRVPVQRRSSSVTSLQPPRSHPFHRVLPRLCGLSPLGPSLLSNSRCSRCASGRIRVVAVDPGQ